MPLRVTWWGHSSATVEGAGQRLLFDPVLTDSIGQLRRRRGPTPAVAARAADVVVISHLHADHCHLPSLRLLEPGVLVIGPRGLAAVVRRVPVRCHELVAGSSVELGDVVLRAVAATHDDRRSPVSRRRAAPLSYLVDVPGHAPLWFGGDTDLNDSMAEVAPVGVALVPVAGWGPTLGPGHLDPERAAEAVRRLRAGVAVPVHYGTFWPRGLNRVRPERFLGPEREFARRVHEEVPATRVRVLAPGDTLEFPDR